MDDDQSDDDLSDDQSADDQSADDQSDDNQSDDDRMDEDMDNEFALHRAAKKGDIDKVRQLIEEGVSVDSLDDMERIPLHWAAGEGRYIVAEFLISNKCDLNLKNCWGFTPVIEAAINRKRDIVYLLLRRGALVDCMDDGKVTLLHLASVYGWTDLVQYFLDRGKADLIFEEGHGTTPLLCAARKGHEDVVALLLQAGADVNRSDENKHTALHFSAEGGHTRVVQVLLKKEGVDLNPQDEEGHTPLHFACYYGFRRVMKELLEAGADANIMNNDGETALSKFLSRRPSVDGNDYIRLFVKHGAFLRGLEYTQISEDPLFKIVILKDVDVCTQSIVNKFNHQSLNALKNISYLTGKLPHIDKLKLKAHHIHDIENFVKNEMEGNAFCNVVKAHPMALSALCVLSLISCQSGTK